jgi:hypothetical protein
MISDRELPLEALSLPADLELPTPAQPYKRLVAGVIDLAVSSAVGAIVAAAMHYSVHVPEATEAAGVVAATVAWVARDCIFDEGNRSVGKKLQDLEVSYWDGTLPQRSDCLKRNVYWAAFPFLYFHPLCNQVKRAMRYRLCATWLALQFPYAATCRAVHRSCTCQSYLTWRPFA